MTRVVPVSSPVHWNTEGKAVSIDIIVHIKGFCSLSNTLSYRIPVVSPLPKDHENSTHKNPKNESFIPKNIRKKLLHSRIKIKVLVYPGMEIMKEDLESNSKDRT